MAGAEREELKQKFTEFAPDYPLGSVDDPDTLRAVALDIEYVVATD